MPRGRANQTGNWRAAVRVPARVRGGGGPLLAVAFGGGAGALTRYGVAQLFPADAGAMPWATLLVNVLGCFLMGSLVVLLDRVWPTQRLLRPFLGVGVLGGFTSFSTYAVDFHELMAQDAVGMAFAYLVGTVCGALVAVVLGTWLARSVLAARAARADPGVR